MQMVYVEWVDSCTSGNEGQTWNKLKDLAINPIICTSAGFLLNDTLDYIVIAAHYCKATEQTEEFYSGEMIIPTKCILSKRYLKIDSIK